jgi:hypothetical protein
MSAYSKEPRHMIYPKDTVGERDAKVFTGKKDVRDSMLADLWFEYHGGA